jgi:hypothetical protein
MLLKCLYDKDNGSIKAYVRVDQDLDVVKLNYTNVDVVDVDVVINSLTAGTYKIDLETLEHIPI